MTHQVLTLKKTKNVLNRQTLVIIYKMSKFTCSLLSFSSRNYANPLSVPFIPADAELGPAQPGNRPWTHPGAVFSLTAGWRQSASWCVEKMKVYRRTSVALDQQRREGKVLHTHLQRELSFSWLLDDTPAGPLKCWSVTHAEMKRYICDAVASVVFSPASLVLFRWQSHPINSPV